MAIEASESGQNRSGLAAGVEPEVDRASSGSRQGSSRLRCALLVVSTDYQAACEPPVFGVEVTATGLNRIC